MGSSTSTRGSRQPKLSRVLAQNVAVHRTRVGISQETLSRQCGLHYSYVGRLERGEGNPRLTTLEGLAGAFGITVAALLTDSIVVDSN